MFGCGQQGYGSEKLPLLCKGLNAKGEWKNHWRMETMGGTAQSRFFPLYPIRPAGRIFCSPEQSKLCFEALETRFVPQNHLPLQGALEHPPKSGFCWILKWIL